MMAQLDKPIAAAISRFAVGGNSLSERDLSILTPIWRQQAAIGRARSSIDGREHLIEMLKRIWFRVPLHEWAEAKARGGNAIRFLLDAYDPTQADRLVRDGFTPRCPPWASRNYVAACRGVGGPAKNRPQEPSGALSATSPAVNA